MTRRMIKRPALPAVRALANRVDAAEGLPRCELLDEAITLDGVAVPSDHPRLSLRHLCTDVAAPHEACPFATRTLADVLELETGEWAYQVVEGHPAVTSALTPAERAMVVDVSPSEIRRTPGPAGAAAAPAKPAAGR
jgi:hypothetical protein